MDGTSESGSRISAWRNYNKNRKGISGAYGRYINSKKIPKYIYIPKDSEWDNLQKILLEAQQNGYSLSENEVSYKLVK